MPNPKIATVRELLLVRRGMVFVATQGENPEHLVRAASLEFSQLGYLLSHVLHQRLRNCSPAELAELREKVCAGLQEHLGANQKHVPLFRNFPKGVPEDTHKLWWDKVLTHFLQSPDQPCIFCEKTGTTHVLNPCRHVVCNHCFDGSNYSACPVCEHQVDRTSPFFLPSKPRGVPNETRIRFKLLHVGQDEKNEARELFSSICARTQALSPTDRDALISILHQYKGEALAWLPEKIPLRENIAVIFGTLYPVSEPQAVYEHSNGCAPVPGCDFWNRWFPATRGGVQARNASEAGP
jgi:hypothetical protein